mgnify:CR=1 FL=1
MSVIWNGAPSVPSERTKLSIKRSWFAPPTRAEIPKLNESSPTNVSATSSNSALVSRPSVLKLAPVLGL